MPQTKSILILVSMALIMSSTIHAQDFAEEFESLITSEKPALLPEKMLISQRI